MDYFNIFDWIVRDTFELYDEIWDRRKGTNIRLQRGIAIRYLFKLYVFLDGKLIHNKSV